MTDVLICSIPAGIINRPPAAPALLKACAVQAGCTAQTVDLSLLLYHAHCDSNFELYSKINRYFEPMVEWEQDPIIELWLENCVNVIKDSNPKFLAISVFSIYQHRATVVLTTRVKQLFPNIKIIVGGYGLPEKIDLSFKNFKKLKGIESVLSFDQYLQKHQLVDYVVAGEGESQFVDILTGSDFSDEPVDLDTVPPGNFSDYKLDQYLWHNEPVLTITSSKGCVRSCTFCNIPNKFGRYRRKSGNLVAEEIIHLSQTYNVHKFEFTDSLVNGSLKDFEQFVTVLADYNRDAEHPVSWYGQYICRPQNQVPSKLYSLMKQSGACNLIIGAESGSDAVLAAMNKKITVKDIFDELDQLEQHGLQAQLLVMGSFYNETWDRFLETLEFIVKCHRYLAAGVVSKIATGLPLLIEHGGYLYQHASELGIVLDEHNVYNWKVVNDPENTWLERIRRRLIMQALLQSMHVSMTGNGILELEHLTEQLKLYEQQLRTPNSKIYTELVEFGPH
jgi:radical SAM superfamily enzyme YgiQ (UPF0313 family)